MSSPRLLVVQNSDHGSPARLGEWLTAAGLSLDVVAPYAAQPLPADLAGHDGLLVLGGPQAAYDPPEDVPWLEPTQALLRHAVAERVPTLAICLGAQLLARAMGGVVRKAENGPELGAQLVAKRDVAADDPVFDGVPFTPDVIQWHYDEIAELPPGAVLLASSPAYVHQAFRLGSCAWGLQFHIETTPEMVAGWAAQGRVAAEEWGYDVDAEVALAAAAHDDIAEVWAPAAARFAALVRDHAAART